MCQRVRVAKATEYVLKYLCKGRKKKNAAINFSLVNKMAMAILSFDKKKEPLRRKRQRAALKEEYLKQLLGKLEEIL